MMFVRIGVLASLLAGSTASFAATLKPLTATHKKDIAAAVKAELKDPESAQFKWLAPKNEALYCGWVNAKNSFGGYIGFKPFLVIGGAGFSKYKPLNYLVVNVTYGDDDGHAQVIKTMCSDKGYSMEAPPVQ